MGARGRLKSWWAYSLQIRWRCNRVERIDEQFLVPAELAGQRFDRAAASLFSSFSRVELKGFIDRGELTVDGAVRPPKSRLQGGEQLTLNAARPMREDWQQAEAIALNVLYEDDDLIVLDKPPGLVVHPGAGNPSGTLVNALLNHRGELAALPRAGIVHRLDKDTSGVMVVAASSHAHRFLTRAIARRTVSRQYIAICEGRMVAGQDVDAPIGRDPHVRTRQAVREDGKPAFTSFRVLERYRLHTLVHAELGSGRTHQIRVHLKSLGFPLVGDKRYGARGLIPKAATEAVIAGLRGFSRQALHAHTLEFEHPGSGDALAFEADLPGDMVALVDLLREDA